MPGGSGAGDGAVFATAGAMMAGFPVAARAAAVGSGVGAWAAVPAGVLAVTGLLGGWGDGWTGIIGG